MNIFVTKSSLIRPLSTGQMQVWSMASHLVTFEVIYGYGRCFFISAMISDVLFRFPEIQGGESRNAPPQGMQTEVVG